MALKITPAFLAFLFFGTLSAYPALGQNPHGKIYDSWRVQCNAPTGAPSNCRIFQNIVIKDSREPILRFFVGYTDQSESPVGLFVVPLGIHLPSGITLTIDNGQAYELSVEVCVPQGCQVRFGFDENFLNLFKKGSTASVSFFGGNNRQPFNIPVSLKGFTAALAAIN